MINLFTPKALLAGLCLGTLVGCVVPDEPAADTDTPVTEDPTPTEAAETAIVLPDGTPCLHAGRGATLTFEGKRLNYTCGDAAGLIGDVTVDQGMDITLEKATIDGTTITGSEPMLLMVSEVTLADGTLCLNAGRGATLAFDEKRLNFSCETVDGGLIGDITEDDGVFMAELALLDGTELISSETVPVARMKTVEP